MSQDIIADALTQLMNAKRIGKKNVILSRPSKLLVKLLEMMKESGHVEFEAKEDDEGKKSIFVQILKLNKCQAVKPRYYVSVSDIEKYLRRFLPSRNFGTLVVSTSKGLMTHQEADKNKLGGALIAYFY